MSNPPTLQATPNVISLLVSASGAMRYVNQDGLTVDLFGRVVARANPLAQQATGGGVTDKRHLWPTWFNLIRECRPPVIFGEQVESAINHGWLDLVQTDLEREDYACGAVGLPAGGVGAPHIRQRLWFVAESLHHGNVRIIGDSIGKKSQNQSGGARIWADETGNHRATDQLADSQRERLERHIGDEFDGNEPGRVNAQQARPIAPSSWSDCDWLPCRDGKARPVEPGTFPLAHGATARVGRLRAYGNAIVPQVAQTFIEAYLES